MGYETGYKVEENSPGIYTVTGDILSIQIINSRRLSAEENLWLKGLSNRLKPLECLKVHDEVYRQKKAEFARAYIYAIAKANTIAVKEAIKMSKKAMSLDEVFESTGLAARWEARTEARVAVEVAQRMINQGYPIEAVASISQLDLEKVKALYPSP